MARVFVGGLPDDVRERDLSDKFSSFGRISSLAIKFPPRAPPFGFIDYDEQDDATKAVDEMNGRDFQGRRLRVEISRSSASRLGDATAQRSTQYRVQLSNLPPRMTWTELKDFLRGGGDVVQADVDCRGGGTASFATYHEMKSAIRTLDRHELEGEPSALPLPLELCLAVAARSNPLANYPSRNEVGIPLSLPLAVSLTAPVQSSPLPLPLALR